MYIPSLAFLYNIQGGQLLLIIVAVLVLFGSKRLPEIARTLGKALYEFRKAASETEKEFIAATTPPPANIANTAQTHETPPRREDTTASVAPKV